jgi:SSS family solute:Na+ symporter
MFTGFVFLLVFSWNYFGPPKKLFTELPEHYFDPTGGNSIQYILVWFFIALWTFIDPGFYQRTAAAKSPKTAQKGILISIGFWFVFDFLTISTGLYAVAILPNQTAAMAYPELAAHILPPFVYGIFLIGLFSTIMSTIDSNGLISAITFGRDILGRIQNRENIGDSTSSIRKGLVVMAFIAVLLSVSIPSIVRLWYVIGSVIVPGLLFPFLLTFSKRKFPSQKIIQVMGIPVIINSLWLILGNINGAYPLQIEPFYPGLIISGMLLYYFVEKDL